MLAKAILSILTVLLMLFPNNTRLQVEYRTRILARDFTVANIVRIINERDIDALEEFMCGNIKRNVANLRDKIGEFFDAIDSEIVEFTGEFYGRYSANHGNGKSLNQSKLAIDFKTATVENYTIHITLETYNSFQPEEMGVRVMFLAVIGDASPALVDIRATNGLGEWHE